MSIYVAPNAPENPKSGDVVIRIYDGEGMMNRFVAFDFYHEDDEGLYSIDYIIDFFTGEVECREHHFLEVEDHKFWTSTEPTYVPFHELISLIDNYTATKVYEDLYEDLKEE